LIQEKHKRYKILLKEKGKKKIKASIRKVKTGKNIRIRGSKEEKIRKREKFVSDPFLLKKNCSTQA